MAKPKNNKNINRYFEEKLNELLEKVKEIERDVEYGVIYTDEIYKKTKDIGNAVYFLVNGETLTNKNYKKVKKIYGDIDSINEYIEKDCEGIREKIVNKINEKSKDFVGTLPYMPNFYEELMKDCKVDSLFMDMMSSDVGLEDILGYEIYSGLTHIQVKAYNNFTNSIIKKDILGANKDIATFILNGSYNLNKPFNLLERLCLANMISNVKKIYNNIHNMPL